MRLLACVSLCYSFNCKMPMQVLFQIKFPQTFLGTQAFTILEHLMICCVHSFPTVWGHFLVFRVNVS